MKNLFLLLFLFHSIYYAKGNDSASSKYDPLDVNTAFGIAYDKDQSDDYIIKLHEYTVSYNKNRSSANWVAWNLNNSWYGEAPRLKGKFITYEELPETFYKADHDDYTKSGYDRGHLVRSEERTRNPKENKATFYMINIIPQTPDLNRGVWLEFENECERLCKEEDKEIFLFAGGIYRSGRKIKNKIEIPDSCFKIAVIMPRGSGLKDTSPKTQIIALVMPNVNGIRNDDWYKYVTTVDRIEASTGYDFLHKLPDAFEEKLESKAYVLPAIKKKNIELVKDKKSKKRKSEAK